MRSKFCLVGFENSKTHSTSKVWSKDHREDDRSCTWPFYSLVQIFPKALQLWLARQLGLYNVTCPNLIRDDNALILVSSDSWSGLLKSLDLSSLADGRSMHTQAEVFIYFWYNCFYHLTCSCFNFYGLSALVGCWSSVFIRRIIYNFF